MQECFGTADLEVSESQERSRDSDNAENHEEWHCVQKSALERVLAIDVAALWGRVVGLMRVVVIPGIGEDHPVVGEEGRVANMLEGVAVIKRLKRVVGVLDSLDAHQFGVLHGRSFTDLYLIQVAVLSTETW